MEPEENPYSAPQFDDVEWSPQSFDKDAKPRVLVWFKVYAIFFAVINAMVVIVAIGAVIAGATVPMKDPNDAPP